MSSSKRNILWSDHNAIYCNVSKPYVDIPNLEVSTSLTATLSVIDTLNKVVKRSTQDGGGGASRDHLYYPVDTATRAHEHR